MSANATVGKAKASEESAALNISDDALNNKKKVVIQKPDDMKDTIPDWFKDVTTP